MINFSEICKFQVIEVKLANITKAKKHFNSIKLERWALSEFQNVYGISTWMIK